MSHPETDILFSEIPAKEGVLGEVVLNRPHALNALTHDMCMTLDEKLMQWATDKNIRAVVVRANGHRAFCAGGDIKSLYAQRHQPIKALDAYFNNEYHLNDTLFHFPKPYLAFLHGITMGGGAGISIHGSHRIASEHFVFAMPEAAIGFFPDVGASYFLSRLPGELGTYLGLTGARITAADAWATGLINFYIPEARLPEVMSACTNLSFSGDSKAHISTLLQSFHVSPGESLLQKHRAEIDHYFTGNSVEDICTRLHSTDSPLAQKTLRALESLSPTSLKVILQELRRAKTMTFDQCIAMEYTLARHFLRGHDFYEGIRAALIQKDKSPQWKPAKLEDISDQEVQKYFQPLSLS